MPTQTQGPVYDRQNEEDPRFEHPDLGPGHDKAAGDSSDPRGHGGAAHNPSDPRGEPNSAPTPRELQDAENAGLYNAGGDSGAESPGGLGDREESGGDEPDDEDDSVGGGYNEGKSKKKGKSRFKLTRQKAALGGIGSAALIGGMFAFFSISSGPLEFVHISQLMEKFHFASQQDAGDGRLTKMARYIRDTKKPQNTRLGIVGNVVADKLEAKINDATGLKSEYDPVTGSFEGYSVIQDNERWAGKSNQEIINELVDTYGLNKSTIRSTLQLKGAPIISFNPDTGSANPIKEYRNQTSFARGLLTEAGLNKVSTLVGTRILRTRASWTFHPIKKIDAKIQAAAIKAGAKGIKKLKDQFTSDQEAYVENGTPTPAAGDPSTEPGKDGKPSTDPTSVGNKDAVDNIKADPSAGNIKAKIAGGGAGLIAVICVLRNVDANITKEREAKVVLPMERFAGQIISVGSQAQSGQDISSLQLGFYKQFLDGTNSKGQTTSTWNQARSIQAELGEPQTGPDIPKQGQVFTKDTPFSFLDNAVTAAACGALGSTLGTIFSIVTGPVNYIVSGELIKDASNFLSDWLSGAPVNPTSVASAGVNNGNYLNYGARAAANQQYASAGGVPMDSADESSLKNTTVALDNADFQSKSLAYRIFNPDDSQTLASRLMDNYSTAGVTQGFANMLHGFGSIFASALKIPATLFSSVVHATPQPYNYNGLQAVGFTAADLANPLYDNSFDNACHVVGNCELSDGTPISYSQSILGDPSQNSLQTQAWVNGISSCFNDKVSFDGTTWKIDFTSGGSTDPYSDSYPTSGCTSHDTKWMRIRFWIFDTQTMEGYDCATGTSPSTSDQSCTDMGFTNSGSSGTSSTPTNTTTSTAGATIDMAHLYDDSTSVACAPGTNDVGIQDGYHDNNKVSIRLCAVPGTTSSSDESNGKYGIQGANGEILVNSRVSGDILAMVQAAKAAGISPASADSSFRTMAHQTCLYTGACPHPGAVAAPGTSNHQMGLAVDWGSAMYTWLANGNGAKFGLKALVPGEPWHWSPSGN